MIKLIWLCIVIVFFNGCVVVNETQSANTNKHKNKLVVLGVEKTKQHNLPFSEAVAVGDLLFLSGQIGTVPGQMKLVAGGIQAQTQQTMLNIFTVLEKYGSNTNKIIKCTVFLDDISDWSQMNVAYLDALGTHRPARSALGVDGLALDAKVEIECIATR
ncbi:MAG: RidA family protein [Colwellia sp.]|nr:RidA family protein [Colwellia sp.]